MFLKKVIPKKVKNFRHLFFAWWGAVKFRHPSEEIFVIGVTGTSGKSSTIYFLRQILEFSGFRLGSLSTIDFYIAGENKLNDQKMTMLGKYKIQKYLREMVEKKCNIALVETTSEGAVQYRHKYINYDVMFLTNLYPEHIESHGSFENYKKAKLSVFEYVSTLKRKNIQTLKKGSDPFFVDEWKAFIPKIAIVNNISEFKNEFLKFPFDSKVTFGPSETSYADRDGLHFVFEGKKFVAPIFGEHNIMNILSTLTFARQLNIPLETLQKAVAVLQGPEGRVEFIPEAKQKGFDVIVDYAFEPVAIQKLYDVVKLLSPKRVIHVFGSTGGGRDISRRFTVGEYVGNNADICIITDEDPYDDDPERIIDDVANAVEKTGKKENESYYRILNRKDAIQKAISLAQPGDLVLVTGKGSEQGMVVKGQIIPWDDRQMVRESLR